MITEQITLCGNGNNYISKPYALFRRSTPPNATIHLYGEPAREFLKYVPGKRFTFQGSIDNKNQITTIEQLTPTIEI